MNWHVRRRFSGLRHNLHARCEHDCESFWAAGLTRDSSRRGFTLIEVLVAATLTLVMMAAVVQIFAIVGESVNNSRSTLEMSEQLRAAVNRLRLDLEGATADMTPPGRPEEGKGYFEYIEGPIGPDPTYPPGFNTDEVAGTPDSTVGDRDDILQFTTRSRNEPFVGRGLVITGPGTSQVQDPIGRFDIYTKVVKSQVAEVAWFLRGTTLYRRVLLVKPSFDADIRTPTTREAEVPYKRIFRDRGKMYGNNASRLMGYYNNYDLSVHWDPHSQRVDGGVGRIVCNTLADLTRRECRYAHPPLWYNGTDWADAFPYSLHLFGNWSDLGLPTLQECSHAAWPFPIDGRMPYRTDGSTAVVLTNLSGLQFDAWVNPYTFDEIDPDTGAINLESSAVLPHNPTLPAGSPPYPSTTDSPRYVGPRVAEDVILTNVLSFDVKAWDPRAPVLRAVGDPGTPADLTDDFALPDPAPAVVPGDANYYIALQHLDAAGALGVLLSRGAYVDLGYCSNLPIIPNYSDFSNIPHSKSQLGTLCIYDTWSIHYEHDGVNQDGIGPPDQGTDGFDNGGVPGVVDDPGELEAPPPYGAPLRGIQIKVRVFEPDSRRVREVTIRHDFLNK